MTKLKAERLKHGWSQLELAYRARVAIAEISRIECGRVSHPYPNHAQRLANVLGMQPHELTEEMEVPEAMHAPAE
jgi:transcriptional regulator with XRE-family HTH domain